jgi:hypothetical protein
MPASSFIGTVSLATGQATPFTGEWVNVSAARNIMLVVYGNRTGVVPVDLQTRTALSGSPVFGVGGAAEGVDLYEFTSVGSGYAPTAFMDSPVSHIRLYSNVSGNNIWGYASLQN